VIILEINKENENIKELENILNSWRYSIIQKRKGINIDNLNIPTTYKVSLKNFDDFNIPMFHPIFFLILDFQ